eukprot:scaffold6067_cov112-Isochrysis_galbana.AAC.10
MVWVDSFVPCVPVADLAAGERGAAGGAPVCGPFCARGGAAGGVGGPATVVYKPLFCPELVGEP